jgi:hypothetical protein
MQLSKFRTLLQVRWSYWRLDWWFDWTTTASSPKAAAIAVIVTITVTSLTDLADEWHASNNINDAGEKGEDSWEDAESYCQCDFVYTVGDAFRVAVRVGWSTILLVGAALEITGTLRRSARRVYSWVDRNGLEATVYFTELIGASRVAVDLHHKFLEPILV